MSGSLHIDILERHCVLHFAEQQLRQLVGQHESLKAIKQYKLYIGTLQQLQQKGRKDYKQDCGHDLARATEGNADYASDHGSDHAAAAAYVATKLGNDAARDEFVIAKVADAIYLIGSNERSALYAVYELVEQIGGVHWLHPAAEPAILPPLQKLEQLTLYHAAPLMIRRGFVFETTDDAAFMQAMVDWLAKNKINELFFTFTLWDKIGGQLQEMIVERGFMITLGGHSTTFFINRMEAAARQSAEHPYTAKQQFDYEDISWQLPLIERIAAYCADITNLSCISLWPEDIKHQQSEQFLSCYIAFCERLQIGLLRAGLSLEVEHIAYNAGLAWDMLERNEQRSSAIIDTLYAYWGRNYEHNLAAGESSSDKRAYQALIAWQQQLQQSGRKLTVFEYYSDHFMLSPLFPMLARRIVKDVADYAAAGIERITNLIVPTPDIADYSWQWNQTYNSYVYARALWNQSLQQIEMQYASQYPAQYRQQVQELFTKLEQTATALTYWNVPLFPARAVDPQRAHASETEAAIIVEQLEALIQAAKQFLTQTKSKREQQALTAEEPNWSHKQLSNLRETARHYVVYSEALQKEWLAFISSPRR